MSFDSAAGRGGDGRRARSRWSDAPAADAGSLPWQACAFILVLAVILGGNTYQRGWPDAVIQIACIPVLLLLSYRIGALWAVSPLHRAGLTICGLAVLLPLLQLIPLPPFIWTFLPGRAPIEAGFLAAELPLPWLPISLSPSETWRSALALLPPVAVFLVAAGLDRASRRSLVLILLALGGISLLVGMAQVSPATSGLFQFYGPGSAPVGFFLNRNHFAALLYAMMPFTAAWIVGLAADPRPQTKLVILFAAVLLACFVLGVGMTKSRAGLLLAVLACLAAFALARGQRVVAGQRLARRLFAAGGFIGLLLLLQFAAIGLLQRATADPFDDERWLYATITLRAALDYLPFGSGLGTFDSVFKSYETGSLLQESYLNNAHNDYAELALEGGLPAVALVLCFLGIFLRAVAGIWRPQESGQANTLDLALRQAACIAASLLLVHSVVDYPLRSAALATVFAFACALLLPAPHEAARASRVGRRGGMGSEQGHLPRHRRSAK